MPPRWALNLMAIALFLASTVIVSVLSSDTKTLGIPPSTLIILGIANTTITAALMFLPRIKLLTWNDDEPAPHG